jgi:peptide deformylase
MAVREILLFSEHPDALRKKSKPIPQVSRKIFKLIWDLKDTLNAHSNGIGLAAPQINVHKRVVVVRLGGSGEEASEPGPSIALVNPEIIEAADERKDFDGCLSFPGLYGETTRPHYLRVNGLDEEGKPFDQVYQGFDAVVVHHEIDHLDGVLFIDRAEKPEDLYWVRVDENGELI